MRIPILVIGCVLAAGFILTPDLKAGTINITWGLGVPPDDDIPAPGATLVSFDTSSNLFTQFIVNWQGISFDFTRDLNNTRDFSALALWQALSNNATSQHTWGFGVPPDDNHVAFFFSFQVNPILTYVSSQPLNGIQTPAQGTYGPWSVPEPSSFALLLAGLSAIALAATRNRS